MTEKGGAVLLENPSKFFKSLENLRQGLAPDRIVFEDFEEQSYGNWEIEGEAFSDKPSEGTSPGQNPVSGFTGKGLVNTYLPDDRPRGRLLSKPFTIEHDFIGFLVGGGGHAGKTCINLKVGGEVKRTATGRWNENLAPAQWDTADLKGQEAVIEIVDDHDGGWGHINIDQIVFSNEPPVGFLGKEEALKTITDAFDLNYQEEHTDFEAAGWEVMSSRFVMIDEGEEFDEYPALARGAFGKATMLIFIEEGMAWPQAINQLAALFENRLVRTGRGLPPHNPMFGNMSLVARGKDISFQSEWKESKALAADLLDDGRLENPVKSRTSPLGTTLNCALAVPFTLAPGQSRTVDFVIAWFFPNLERFGHVGNQYAAHFPNAWAVSSYVCKNFDRLRETTLRYHDTLYETNLPYWMIDCLSSQSCIFRTVNCFYAARHAATNKPYFAGYEGCYGCCPLNCTHVWNYAQAHARLYPELGRNLRWYDFMHYLKEDGETQHRQHREHGAFIDGHCAVIEAAYREYLLSPDMAFLEEIWPGVKKAMLWLIQKIDPDEDGVNSGHQWNTYDVATSGAHTFIGSQYLSALAAAEKMAEAMKDQDFQAQCRRLIEAGGSNQDSRLWNGEYYIQIPDKEPARDYNTGCHSDQLLGQWWAHMLDNGYLYPADHVRTALASIYKYNMRENFAGFEQIPRRYVIDEEGGLLICTWPQGGRPDPFILYADEIWTGIEYATAGLMIYEGMLEEAFRIVKTARDRYDGRLREGLNSGPGGNPFNELECGRFYARALSSWSLLLAAQGFIYEGPKARIGFIPRWKSEEHKSLFVASEGWGLFRQLWKDGVLEAAIEVRYGNLAIKEVILSRGSGASEEPRVTVELDGTAIRIAETKLLEDRTVLVLANEVSMRKDQTLRLNLVW
jgi:hypothetical protein